MPSRSDLEKNSTTPSVVNGGGDPPAHEHGTRKRKRVVSGDVAASEVPGKKRLTSRQMALKQKEEQEGGDKEAGAIEPPLLGPPIVPVKQLSDEQKSKKSKQAERRKRQKEEQMESQKDAILQKIANAVNARSDTTVGTKEKRKKRESFGEIRYVNSKSGGFLSFAPHVPVPSYLNLNGNTTSDSVREKKETPSLCIVGCGNVHKYYDSKTHQPLCSLKCYRIHQQQQNPSVNSHTTTKPQTTPSASSLSSRDAHRNQKQPQQHVPSSNLFQQEQKKPLLPPNVRQQMSSPSLETLA